MDVPADRSRPTSAPPLHPTLREAARSPTLAAAQRGGPAAALSAPDQWHRLAGGRAGPLAAGRKPADGPDAHHDLALASVMVDKQGQVWLVDLLGDLPGVFGKRDVEDVEFAQDGDDGECRQEADPPRGL